MRDGCGPEVVLMCGVAGSGKTTYAQHLETQGYVRLSIDEEVWQRSSRDAYKSLIEQAGGRWRLLYFQADPALLRKRLAQRSQRFDANAAFPVNQELLERYLSGFQAPNGEGEEVVTTLG